MTFETPITILTIENLDSWQSLLPDNQLRHWTAFAIIAMFCVLDLSLYPCLLRGSLCSMQSKATLRCYTSICDGTIYFHASSNVWMEYKFGGCQIKYLHKSAISAFWRSRPGEKMLVWKIKPHENQNEFIQSFQYSGRLFVLKCKNFEKKKLYWSPPLPLRKYVSIFGFCF